MSALVENIVNVVNVHHLENCGYESSLVKLTKCKHVFHAFNPYQAISFSFVHARNYFNQGFEH
jgi:hypothetical protein